MKILFAILAMALSAPAFANTYSTTFPATENPISQGGLWVSGASAGGSLWGDVQTTSGLAFGVSLPTTFGDPTAVLTGTWGPNQTVQVTVAINNTIGTNAHEVEIRLRTTISANSITGYEINCSVVASDPYVQIIRWQGPNGSFTGFASTALATPCVNGDVFKATIVTSGGNAVITVIRNGTTLLTGTDDGSFGGAAFTTGNPGIGFFDNGDTNWNFFGFSAFSATDGLTATTGALLGGAAKISNGASAH